MNIYRSLISALFYIRISGLKDPHVLRLLQIV